MQIHLCAVLGVAGLLASTILSVNAGADERQECSASQFQSTGLTSYAATREQRIANTSENEINPGMNGSIKVHGWNQADVLVRACIIAAAPTADEARSLVAEISIVKSAGEIEATGPSPDDRRNWSVSYDIWLPNADSIKLDAYNGSISVAEVSGQIHFKTLNGSVHLQEVSGEVEGSSTNGSLAITIPDGAWAGKDIRVKTTNGSVNLRLPSDAAAHVDFSTVNGSIHSDFPMTMESEESRKHVFFDIGGGGPTIAAETVNGSVHIGRGA